MVQRSHWTSLRLPSAPPSNSSDTYQACLGKDIDDQKAAATPDKPFDKAIATRDTELAATNQKMKEDVGASVNAAIATYKKAHPAQ
jgi:hypothetical protein